MHILVAANMKKCNTADFTCRAIKRMGHTFTLLSPLPSDYTEWIKVEEDVDLNVVVKDLNTKADLFLFIESSTGNPFFPEGIPELDMPTAWWATDNYLNFRWEKEYCALFDYAFFVQLGRMRLAQKAGARNLHWLPFAADEEAHRDFGVERDIDVGYVGSIIDAKRRYFARLERAGVALTTNDRYFLYDEVGEFYSRCKAVYNICARFDMNVRTFEAAAAGALLVSQGNVDEGFYEIFTPGENADVHDFDDAADVIRRYLADPEKLRRVAEAGRETVLAGHTYRHRVETVLRVAKGGITERRRVFAHSGLRYAKEATTYQHRQFRLYGRAFTKLKTAFAKAPFGTIAYLLKYAAFRVYEKAEKMIWKLGKAPV